MHIDLSRFVSMIITVKRDTYMINRFNRIYVDFAVTNLQLHQKILFFFLNKFFFRKIFIKEDAMVDIKEQNKRKVTIYKHD